MKRAGLFVTLLSLVATMYCSALPHVRNTAAWVGELTLQVDEAPKTTFAPRDKELLLAFLDRIKNPGSTLAKRFQGKQMQVFDWYASLLKMTPDKRHQELVTFKEYLKLLDQHDEMVERRNNQKLTAAQKVVLDEYKTALNEKERLMNWHKLSRLERFKRFVRTPGGQVTTAVVAAGTLIPAAFLVRYVLKSREDANGADGSGGTTSSSGEDKGDDDSGTLTEYSDTGSGEGPAEELEDEADFVSAPEHDETQRELIKLAQAGNVQAFLQLTSEHKELLEFIRNIQDDYFIGTLGTSAWFKDRRFNDILALARDQIDQTARELFVQMQKEKREYTVRQEVTRGQTENFAELSDDAKEQILTRMEGLTNDYLANNYGEFLQIELAQNSRNVGDIPADYHERFHALADRANEYRVLVHGSVQAFRALPAEKQVAVLNRIRTFTGESLLTTAWYDDERYNELLAADTTELDTQVRNLLAVMNAEKNHHLVIQMGSVEAFNNLSEAQQTEALEHIQTLPGWQTNPIYQNLFETAGAVDVEDAPVAIGGDGGGDEGDADEEEEEQAQVTAARLRGQMLAERQEQALYLQAVNDGNRDSLLALSGQRQLEALLAIEQLTYVPLFRTAWKDDERYNAIFETEAADIDADAQAQFIRMKDQKYRPQALVGNAQAFMRLSTEAQRDVLNDTAMDPSGGWMYNYYYAQNSVFMLLYGSLRANNGALFNDLDQAIQERITAKHANPAPTQRGE